MNSRRRLTALVLLLLFFACSLCPPATLAQVRSATARAAYEKGLNAIKQKDWNLALRSFLDAQAADPYAPPTLFNLGLVSEKIPGHQLRAIAWFQAYLLAAPGSPDAAAVRNEVARLEASYEAANRAILDQLDSFISLAKKNIDQLSAKDGAAEWANAANHILAVAAEFQAGSHYFVGDDSGALRVLHVADEKIFRDRRLVLPAPGSSNMPRAMVSAGFEVEAIVNRDKSGRGFASGPLDYLLEVGDLEHAWTYLQGWEPDDNMWILSMESFLCTAHDRSDRAVFNLASPEIEKSLAGMADARGFYDLIRLYLEIGEVARAEALAKTIPGDLEQQTLKRYVLPADGFDFHKTSLQSHPGACPATLWILQTVGSYKWNDTRRAYELSASNPPTLQWVEGRSIGQGWEGNTLWWSTGRLAFLAEVGRKGLTQSFDGGWDETRLGDYIKKVGDEILADPYSIKNNSMELARIEFLVSGTYRMIRGPIQR